MAACCKHSELNQATYIYSKYMNLKFCYHAFKTFIKATAHLICEGLNNLNYFVEAVLLLRPREAASED